MYKIKNQEFRYNKLNNYFYKKYGTKVFKIPINVGFTCPNRDGSKGYGGCTFCSESGSGDFAGNPLDDIKTQFNKIKNLMHTKWNEGKYIVYFQANTNTYADINILKNYYETAINLDSNIVGISISTRPDCVNEEIINYLKQLNTKIDVYLELGLQTINDKINESLNRQHTLKDFNNAINLLEDSNIHTIVHIINGLPGENKEDMINTVKYLSKLNVQGIKIHLLHIMKKTVMGNQYLKNPFKILSLDEYVNIVCDQIEYLNPNIVIHRLTGDAPKNLLIEPQWSLKKFVVMNEIDKELRLRDTYQGARYL